MLSCSFATAARCEVRRPCRVTSAKTSSSFPIAAKTRSSSGASPRKDHPNVAQRPSPGRPGRRVVAAAAPSQQSSCSRDLLCVGPGVLGSLVCQRWLNVRNPHAIHRHHTASFLGFFFVVCFFPRPIVPLFLHPITQKVLTTRFPFSPPSPTRLNNRNSPPRL
jgi:hypothetical protein